MSMTTLIPVQLANAVYTQSNRTFIATRHVVSDSGELNASNPALRLRLVRGGFQFGQWRSEPWPQFSSAPFVDPPFFSARRRYLLVLHTTAITSTTHC